MTIRTLVVWCPDWPVVASGRAATAPVALVVANRVVACSAAARADGVCRGLRRREAQGRCPELEVLGVDLGGEARAFEPVVAAVAGLTPRVEVVRPGVCAFATRGPSRYFGGDDGLAVRVADVVDGVLPAGAPGCRVGVADGPFAAELAAREGHHRLLIVPRGQARAWLAPVPVSCLEPSELVDLLLRLGLRTLGDLAALPAGAVLSRFGPQGAAASRLARGLDERPLAARTPPPDLAVQAELDPPAERVDTAAFVAKGLADELHRRLAERGLACTRVVVEVETEHGESLRRFWRHDGALTASAMAERARWQLEGWLASGAATAGITLVRLIPDEIKPDDGRQLGFWGGSAAADDRAARSFARIQGLLGPEAVVTAVVGGGRGPGERVHLVPWGDPRQPFRPDGVMATGRALRGTHLEAPPWPGHVPPPAPSLVHDPPLAAEVVDTEGRRVGVTARVLLSAVPDRVSVTGGAEEEVSSWAGPWPADERWWDRAAHRRRARLQICTRAGTAYLLALEAGQWVVEATYD